MTVEIPRELASRVQEEADKEGVEPAEFILRAVAEKVSTGDPLKRVLWNGMTVEEWIRGFEDWTNSHPDVPALPPEAYERESFYEDRW